MKTQVKKYVVLAFLLSQSKDPSQGQNLPVATPPINPLTTNSSALRPLPDSVVLPPVTVTGTLNSRDKGILSSDVAALPATVEVVTQDDILKIPILSYGDLYRSLPGFDVANYGQGGLGYGIAVRGWDDSEHGHDIATFIDGMPINEASSLQVNGYTDLNPLIPELVKSLEFTYGPFNPRYGNFALAGSASFTTLDAPASGLYLSGGSFNTVRELAVYNISADGLDAYTALEADSTSGYRDNQKEERINSFSKVTFPLFSGVASLRGQVFLSDWGAPGYLNRALVESGELSSKAAIDPTDGGSKTEENSSFNYTQGDADNSFTVNSYFIHDFFARYRDRDTSPIGPGNPTDQSLQTDDRMTFGINAERYKGWELPYSMSADAMVGMGVRVDVVQAESYDTFFRTPFAATGDEVFDQYNPYVYSQFDLKPLSWLKLTAGARYDDFSYDINDKTAGLTISPNVGSASPKIGITATPIKEIALFANYAYGVRGPDATSDLLSNPSTAVATLNTVETGMQYNNRSGTLHFNGDVYETYISNELEDNDVTTPINLGKSQRRGFDLDGKIVAYRGHGQALSLVADYSMVNARLLDQPIIGGGNYIPNVPPWLVSYGLDYQLPLFSDNSPNVVNLSFRHQFTGEKKLTTDGSATTSEYSRISTKLSYTRVDWHNFTAFIDLIIYPDNRLSEAAFELRGGIVGVSPQAPVAVNAGISANF